MKCGKHQNKIFTQILSTADINIRVRRPVIKEVIRLDDNGDEKVHILKLDATTVKQPSNEEDDITADTPTFEPRD